jgi:hypothetical protein
MHKLFAVPVTKVLPDVKIPEPRISPLVVIILRLLGRFYLFIFYGIARIVLRGEKDLFEAFKRHLEGKSRCIIAFRHPNGGEPQLLSWFFLFRLRLLAGRAGIRFPRFPHAVFVYGYEVVRWGGWIARLVMPNVGAMPIHHSKLDREGMSRIYKTIIEGPHPLALAPEGQVSYTTDSVPRLEQGVIRIGFGAANLMESKGESAPLEILPVAVHFRFGSWGRLTLEGLLRKIEKYTGVKGRKLPLCERLKASRDAILVANEKRYGLESNEDLLFEQRLNLVIVRALETTERILGVKTGENNLAGDRTTIPEEELFSRMYSLRQICWDRRILPGVDTLANHSRVERGIMDLRAGEAWYAGRHLELVDFAWYFRGPVPGDDEPLHHKIEYSQNLWDFANRTMGGAYSNRISIFPRRVIIQAAPVINLSERLPSYHKDKKAAIAKALSDLRDSYYKCINEVNKMD